MATQKAETEKLTPIYPVNMRSEPEVGAPLVFCGPKGLHYLTPGIKVALIEKYGEWVKVRVYGKNVWCIAKYMKPVD